VTKIVILDAATGEVIDREMNAEELAQFETDKSNAPDYSSVGLGVINK
jgi:hypothetical protein